MYLSHPLFDDLLLQLYQAAKVYHGKAVEYYSVINSNPKDKSEAAKQYRIAGEAYLDGLFACEQYLLSINREEDLEIELVHIQAIRHAVQTTLFHL